MKAIPSRNIVGGFTEAGERIVYEKGKVQEVPEKFIQQFPDDFKVVKQSKETAEGTGGKK